MRWRARTIVQPHGARRAGRPQLKRDPFGSAAKQSKLQVPRTLWFIIVVVVGTTVGRYAGVVLSRAFAATRRLFRRRSAPRPNPTPWVPGQIYSVRRDPLSFGLVKILAADSDAVHVRLYKHTFPVRPEVGSSPLLALGTLNDADGFGIGHVPLAHDAFQAWEPVLVRAETVSDAELEGYNMWLEHHGGVFR